jgi:hypothetical protein
MQMAGSFYDQRFYLRKTENNPEKSWREIVTVDENGNIHVQNRILKEFSGRYEDLQGLPDFQQIGLAIGSKANMSHRHNIDDIDFLHLGNNHIESGRSKHGQGIYTYGIYHQFSQNVPNGLYYGCVLNISSPSSASAVQIIAGWGGASDNYIGFRSLRDTIDDWSAIKRIYHEGFKPKLDDIEGLNDTLRLIRESISLQDFLPAIDNTEYYSVLSHVVFSEGVSTYNLIAEQIQVSQIRMNSSAKMNPVDVGTGNCKGVYVQDNNDHMRYVTLEELVILLENI